VQLIHLKIMVNKVSPPLVKSEGSVNGRIKKKLGGTLAVSGNLFSRRAA
jgi:hypothetical protein